MPNTMQKVLDCKNEFHNFTEEPADIVMPRISMFFARTLQQTENVSVTINDSVVCKNRTFLSVI